MEQLLVNVTLTVIEGHDHEKTIRMTTPVMTIGRKNTKFNLNDTKISTHHVNVEIQGKDVFVIDQDSRNGIKLNGLDVQKARLKDLDVIELGFTKIQVNIVENLQAFRQANTEDSETKQSDISSLIDDELDRFSKWDLSSPDIAKDITQQSDVPFGLEVTKGPDKGKKYLFPKDVVIIGRGNVDCMLRDQDISRKHAQIEYDESSQTLHIKDLNSTNGIFVNGVSVTSAKLSPGDIVQAGATLFVIVRVTHG